VDSRLYTPGKKCRGRCPQQRESSLTKDRDESRGGKPRSGREKRGKKHKVGETDAALGPKGGRAAELLKEFCGRWGGSEESS